MPAHYCNFEMIGAVCGCGDTECAPAHTPVPEFNAMSNDNVEPGSREITQSVGYVEISQDRDWFGPPRRAAFAVYVDGSHFGTLAIKSTIRMTLPIGPHRLRIRQFYFMSPTVNINVESGQTLRLKADIPRIPLLRRFLKMLRIFRALDLSILEGKEEIGAQSVRLKSPSQRRVLTSAFLQLLGFALLIVSIAQHNWLLAISSIVLVLAGLGTAIYAVRSHRRVSSKPL